MEPPSGAPMWSQPANTDIAAIAVKDARYRTTESLDSSLTSEHRRQSSCRSLPRFAYFHPRSSERRRHATIDTTAINAYKALDGSGTPVPPMPPPLPMPVPKWDFQNWKSASSMTPALAPVLSPLARKSEVEP